MSSKSLLFMLYHMFMRIAAGATDGLRQGFTCSMLCAQKFRLSKIPGFVHKRLPEIPGFMLGSHRTRLFHALRSKYRLSKIPGFVLERLPEIPGFLRNTRFCAISFRELGTLAPQFHRFLQNTRFSEISGFVHLLIYNRVFQLGNTRLYVFREYPVLCMLKRHRKSMVGNTRFCVIRKYPVLCCAA